MGCVTKFFSNTLSVSDLMDYIRTNYGLINSDFGIYDKDYGRVTFSVGPQPDDVRIMWVYTKFDIDDHYDYPEKTVYGKTISLSLGMNEQAIEIMTKIAKQFGGYVCEDDSRSHDSPIFWKKYYADSEYNNTAEKIYELMEEDAKKNIRNSAEIVNLIEFIMRHKEDFKKFILD